MNSKTYEDLRTKMTAPQWQRIGLHRRAGVVAPLFSIYSEKSIGIGELPDLKALVDWCKIADLSIIQLLPLNDTGFGFRPYDAQSMFALEPMYLCFEELTGLDTSLFMKETQALAAEFPTGKGRVDYRIKAKKLALFWKAFQTVKNALPEAFEVFVKINRFWLEDYALFKVIKEKNMEKSWEEWDEGFKGRSGAVLSAFKEGNSESVLFYKWLQWQLCEQFKSAKEYASSRDVLLMGDIPFLVSRDSADVWSRQHYFKLWLSSGAPPDLLFSKGQRWGMPPFNWEEIARHKYDYLIEKLRFAQNFYDLYRIDHVVGAFRIWTIPLSEPAESGGLNGVYDPLNEKLWEEHGRRLLSVMLESSTMLACAEDLGTIPPVCFKVLEELGVPGIDVQRWMRDWGKTYSFKGPDEYRPCAIGTIATHDLSNLCAWWLYECGTVDEELFKRNCLKKNLDFEALRAVLFDLDASSHGRLRWKKEVNTREDFLSVLNIPEAEVWELLDMFKGSIHEKSQFLKLLGLDKEDNLSGCSVDFIKRSLEKAATSSCIFSIQLIQDYLSIDPLYDCDPWENRINFPGTLSDKNWTLALPVPLEDLIELPINESIQKINKSADRV